MGGREEWGPHPSSLLLRDRKFIQMSKYKYDDVQRTRLSSKPPNPGSASAITVHAKGRCCRRQTEGRRLRLLQTACRRRLRQTEGRRRRRRRRQTEGRRRRLRQTACRRRRRQRAGKHRRRRRQTAAVDAKGRRREQRAAVRRPTRTAAAAAAAAASDVKETLSR